MPAAILVLLAGMAISGRIYYATHRFKPGEVVLSDLENREENPTGYMVAAAGTAIACALLFPAAPLFRRAMRGSRWGTGGALIYGVGSASGIAMAALEPFLDLYHPLHILLAFTTFLGLIGGLACVSVAAARARLRPGRCVWTAVAFVHVMAMLMALGAIPLPQRGSAGFWNSLAAGELALVVLIGAGTAGLAADCGRQWKIVHICKP